MMAELRDGFLRELDKEASGIQGHIFHYDKILRMVDNQLWSAIAQKAQVTHQFYSLSWFMLLMCQEFELLCVLRLWDTLMAAEGPDSSSILNPSNQ